MRGQVPSRMCPGSVADVSRDLVRARSWDLARSATRVRAGVAGVAPPARPAPRRCPGTWYVPGLGTWPEALPELAQAWQESRHPLALLLGVTTGHDYDQLAEAAVDVLMREAH